MAGGRLEASAELRARRGRTSSSAPTASSSSTRSATRSTSTPHLGRRHDRRLVRRRSRSRSRIGAQHPRRGAQVPRRGRASTSGRSHLTVAVRRRASRRRDQRAAVGRRSSASTSRRPPEGVARVARRDHRPGRAAARHRARAARPTPGTADGTAAKPFVVFAEFEIIGHHGGAQRGASTSAAPRRRATPSSGLGIAPMNMADAGTALRLTLAVPTGDQTARPSADEPAPCGRRSRSGVWGLPQTQRRPEGPGGRRHRGDRRRAAVHRGRHPGRAAADRLSPRRDRHRAARCPSSTRTPTARISSRRPRTWPSCCRPNRRRGRVRGRRAVDGRARVTAPRRWRRCAASATRRRGSARSPTAWRRKTARDAGHAAPRPGPPVAVDTRRGHARGRRCPDLGAWPQPEASVARTTVKDDRGAPRQRRRRRSPACRPRWTCPCPRSCIASAASSGARAGRHGRGLGRAAAEPRWPDRRDRCGRRPRRGRRRPRDRLTGMTSRAGRTSAAPPPRARRWPRARSPCWRCPTPSATSATPSGRSCWSAVRRARVVALAHGGAVLADATTDRPPTRPPSRSCRAPSASPSRWPARDGADAPGLLGWHAGTELAYLGLGHRARRAARPSAPRATGVRSNRQRRTGRLGARRRARRRDGDGDDALRPRGPRRRRRARRSGRQRRRPRALARPRRRAPCAPRPTAAPVPPRSVVRANRTVAGL